MSAAAAPQHWDGPFGGDHHNETFTMQKYLLLQEQHELLRQHIDQLRLPQSNTATSTPLGSPTQTHGYPSSPDSSPYASRSPSTTRNHNRSRRPSLPPPTRTNCAFEGLGVAGLETVLDESTLNEVALEEAKLVDVNEGIKRALTELLNCRAVRGDRILRTWVQRRLMETEKELRLGRRRRSAPGWDS